jgi:decaprenyl-phosphate phosphoribosyltransferase
MISASLLSPPHWAAGLLSAMRPRQWTKNLIVFAPLLFAFEFSAASVMLGVYVFTLFCLMSSGFYLYNDVIDVEADRLHPRKRFRAVAAGTVSASLALTVAFSLICTSVAAAMLVSPVAGQLMLFYALLQFLYNWKLKQIVLLDVMGIAAGFVLRASGGAAMIHIPPSPWFLMAVALLALFLAIEKRKAELGHSTSTRAVLREYSPALLARMEQMVSTGVILTYALWSSGPQVNGAQTPWMMLTLPFVLYGLFRYQYLGERHAGVMERPEEILLSDLPILVAVAGWATMVFAVLWLRTQRLLP